MEWYLVIKTINGKQYYYKQKTYRVGKHVKTQNIYVGPVGFGRPAMPIKGGWKSNHPDLGGAVTLPIQFPERTPGAIHDVASVLNTLVGDKSSSWGQAWDRHRLKREGTLVVRDRQIEEAIGRLGVSWLHRNSGCWYSPSTDAVNIPPEYRFFNTEAQTATQAYYVVVFHELVHWTRRRVGREKFAVVGGGARNAYAAEELVAELGALTLMECFGMKVGDEKRHAHYFQHWRDHINAEDRDAAIEYAKNEAAVAVKYILEHGKVTS